MCGIPADLLILALAKAQADQAKGAANHSESRSLRHLVQSCRFASSTDGSGGQWGEQTEQQQRHRSGHQGFANLRVFLH